MGICPEREYFVGHNDKKGDCSNRRKGNGECIGEGGDTDNWTTLILFTFEK